MDKVIPIQSGGIEVILVRTNYDPSTALTNKWAAELPTMLNILHDLESDEATADELRSALATVKGPALIAFYGHGEKDHLVAQETALHSVPPRLITVRGDGVLPDELRRHNVYAVACWAGAQLSHALGRKKCSFVGYKYEFMFPDSGLVNDFMKIVNDAFCLWAKGGTAKEVGQQLRREWLARARAYKANPPGDPQEYFESMAAGLAAMNNHWAVISLGGS
jgi:hypothetical protein